MLFFGFMWILDGVKVDGLRIKVISFLYRVQLSYRLIMVFSKEFYMKSIFFRVGFIFGIVDMLMFLVFLFLLLKLFLSICLVICIY